MRKRCHRKVLQLEPLRWLTGVGQQHRRRPQPFLIRTRIHTQTQLGPETTGHLSPVGNLTITETGTDLIVPEFIMSFS